MRDCGNCTWCCYFCAVPEYNSPVNEYCTHCIKDVGCSVHEERQEVCRSFGCLWLLQTQLPDYLRPDKCSVMFEVPIHNKTYVGYVDPNNKEAFRSNEVMILIGKVIAIGNPVVIHVKGLNNYVFKPAEWSLDQVKQDVLNGWNKFQGVM